MRASSSWRPIPWSLLLCVAGLLAMGISGIARGDELNGDTSFCRKQLVWLAIVLPTGTLCTLFNYRVLARSGLGMLLGCIVLLLAVYLCPSINGSRRWIPLGFFNFQPSEPAKLAFILALAGHLRFQENYRSWSGLLIPFMLTLVPLGLILREPDLGTALLFLPVLYAMLFAAGARPRHLALLTFLGLLLVPVLWMGMSAEQRSRVTAVFQQRDGGPTPQGDGYHLHQAKQVLALGGAWGSEFGDEVEHDSSAYHLPAAQTDFIFCMIGERWGLGGCLLTLLLYLVMFAQGLKIAAGTKEPFGRLVAVGTVALLATQTIINTGMTVGLMPITGLTLPLVSYGGSSLLSTGIALGLLVNIAVRPGYELSGEPFRFRSS